ncbi:MAG: DUF928 domain-containing protein [Acaryochloris sp. RU_4_1]|nr:DUF928 domain-containing protein [Acaryochloris sp. SU_5_25]NJM68683.1 DUF928 domain-containing protein [Acaryochloris sp. RU_4_1]NJR55938.1 DUF928 domain-containing protein [Acaryochloris sp. CRU_2_0]
MKQPHDHRIWVKGFMVLVACVSVAPVAVAFPLQVIQIAQTTEYQRAMQLGYRTSTTNLKAALAHFQRALKLLPGDRKAQIALRNINRQLQRNKVFHVTPSGIRAPAVRSRGATRNQNCLNGHKVIALIPEHQLGFTAKAHPVLLFHIPATSAPQFKMTLAENGSSKTLYEKTLSTAIKSGLVRFELTEFPALELQKTYQWSFTLLCDPQDPSADVTVSGMIRRVELDPILLREIENVELSDRAILSAINGLWYDAIDALANARQSNPKDNQLVANWIHLLKSEGLDSEINQSAKK